MLSIRDMYLYTFVLLYILSNANTLNFSIYPPLPSGPYTFMLCMLTQYAHAKHKLLTENALKEKQTIRWAIKRWQSLWEPRRTT